LQLSRLPLNRVLQLIFVQLMGVQLIGDSRLEDQGPTRAGRHRLPGQGHQIGVDRPAVDQGITPLVESDPFRQQFGTEAVGVAGHRVHP
jgi:hypothetical protein